MRTGSATIVDSCPHYLRRYRDHIINGLNATQRTQWFTQGNAHFLNICDGLAFGNIKMPVVQDFLRNNTLLERLGLQDASLNDRLSLINKLSISELKAVMLDYPYYAGVNQNDRENGAVIYANSRRGKIAVGVITAYSKLMEHTIDNIIRVGANIPGVAEVDKPLIIGMLNRITINYSQQNGFTLALANEQPGELVQFNQLVIPLILQELGCENLPNAEDINQHIIQVSQLDAQGRRVYRSIKDVNQGSIKHLVHLYKAYPNREGGFRDDINTAYDAAILDLNYALQGMMIDHLPDNHPERLTERKQHLIGYLQQDVNERYTLFNHNALDPILAAVLTPAFAQGLTYEMFSAVYSEHVFNEYKEELIEYINLNQEITFDTLIVNHIPKNFIEHMVNGAYFKGSTIEALANGNVPDEAFKVSLSEEHIIQYVGITNISALECYVAQMLQALYQGQTNLDLIPQPHFMRDRDSIFQHLSHEQIDEIVNVICPRNLSVEHVAVLTEKMHHFLSPNHERCQKCETAQGINLQPMTVGE